MANIAKKIPTDLFEYIGKHAGVVLSDFSVDNWTVNSESILGATSGGINFTDTPTFSDYGADIDNCPKNTKELKVLDDREVKVSGTFVSMKPNTMTEVIAAADYDSSKHTITPRDDLELTDFKKMWFVFDYGDGNAVAIEIDNALSTSGLSIQTSDDSKTQFSFEYTAHYSMETPEKIPYTVHFKS